MGRDAAEPLWTACGLPPGPGEMVEVGEGYALVSTQMPLLPTLTMPGAWMSSCSAYASCSRGLTSDSCMPLTSRPDMSDAKWPDALEGAGVS